MYDPNNDFLYPKLMEAHREPDAAARHLATSVRAFDHAWEREPLTMADLRAYLPRGASLSRGQILMRDYALGDAMAVLRKGGGRSSQKRPHRGWPAGL